MRPAPEIIAHRGANREAPENSIPAFAKALEIGVDGIELDVHVTRDNVAVVHHDPVLPEGERIDGLLSADLERRTDSPTLAEVLDVVAGRCHVYVELKAADALDSTIELLKHRTDWCSLHSFDHRIARHANENCPGLATGILLVSRLVDITHAVHSAKAIDVWQHVDYIDHGLIAELHREGARIIAWTVNDVARALELQDLGVDGICTDAPRELLKGMNRATS